ncbi:MAG: translation initiation factor IF-2 [Oscillospiraceae bacterium]|jgi:translation initiation factor IF-2|nr:translation initiation factor IF-2 [Oscillospiraceae bacterium]
MAVRNKVHEVAKDLSVQSKEITSILGKYLTEPKSTQQPLTDEELNIVFDVLTLENQTDGLFEIMEGALKNPPPKPAESASEQKADKPKAPSKPSAKKPEAPPITQADKPKFDKTSDTSPPEISDPKKLEDAKEAERNRNLLRFAVPAAPYSKDKKKREQDKKQSQRANQLQTLQRDVPVVAGGVTFEERKETNDRKRVIDTSGATVNLAKYDDRFNSYESERDANNSGKQKLKKKNDRNTQQPTMAQGAKKRSELRAKEQRRLLEEARKQVLTVPIPDTISIGELASRMKKTVAETLKQFIRLGTFVTINDIVDYDTAALAAMELGCKVEREVTVSIEEKLFGDEIDRDEDLTLRAPVVVVMGHVDHGKTSLLDRIRDANVADGEAGGITQHIGAYQVEVNGDWLTFLDTPGHEAFTSMRARGAMITDIAILVVAADDGIMPQTVEAINHAKAADIPIIVAINKMDKAGANPDRIKQQLTEYELITEDWGGDTIAVPISAKTGMGIDTLLEMVKLTAEMRELKANPNRLAKGAVIEARLDKGRGPIATLLVQNGTLKRGDVIIAGTAVGHVRTMTNSRGEQIDEAGPSVPVEITGLSEAPAAGEDFSAVTDERMARELAGQRIFNSKSGGGAVTDRKVSLDNLFDTLQEGELKELAIIVKADVQGSAEAVKASLEKLENPEVRVRVIHSAVGTVTESDIMLAATSNAIIVGFNIRPDSAARDSAERQGVDMRMYRVIYECVEEIEAAMKGMLAPKYRENVLGHAEVREVYKVSKVGAVAGCYVREGSIKRGSSVRVIRDGIIVFEGALASLRRFKDDVREVASGYECGIGVEKFNDIKISDIIESFEMEEIK